MDDDAKRSVDALIAQNAESVDLAERQFRIAMSMQDRLMWRAYAAAAISAGCGSLYATEIADKMSAAERKRFGRIFDGEEAP